MKEEIVNPKRYTYGGMECWDFWLEADLNPIIASAVKYVWRYKHKNGRQDLEKALVFLEKASKLDPFLIRLSKSHYTFPWDIEGFDESQILFMNNAVLSTHPMFYELAIGNMKMIVEKLIVERMTTKSGQ